jgi:transposase
VTRSGMLSDAMWARIEPLLPSSNGKRGGRWTDHRTVVEGIAWRFRAGTPWRDVPDDFGSWKTLWKRPDRWSGDSTWDRLLTEMCADADAVAELDWLVAVDSSINRAHQHAAGARRITDPTATDTESVESVESPTAAQTHAGGDTGGGVE